MRKLLIVVLALSTFAWAHGAKKTDQTRSSAGNDWYQAMLNPQINHWTALNKPEVIGPPAIAFSEEQPAFFQTPASMAARQGGGDWYNQHVAIAAEVNQRDLQALRTAPRLDKNAKVETH